MRHAPFEIKDKAILTSRSFKDAHSSGTRLIVVAHRHTDTVTVMVGDDTKPQAQMPHVVLSVPQACVLGLMLHTHSAMHGVSDGNVTVEFAFRVLVYSVLFGVLAGATAMRAIMWVFY